MTLTFFLPGKLLMFSRSATSVSGIFPGSAMALLVLTRCSNRCQA